MIMSNNSTEAIRLQHVTRIRKQDVPEKIVSTGVDPFELWVCDVSGNQTLLSYTSKRFRDDDYDRIVAFIEATDKKAQHGSV